MTDQTPRNVTRALVRGLRDVSPILPGIVPFGLLAGATALAAGLDAGQAQGMSLIIFAGASQLAAIELFARQAAWPVVLLTILVINLRFVMYSAVLAPWFADRSRPLRALLAAVLTDQAFAVTVARHRRDPAPRPLCWYYLGAASVLWGTWQASTFAGIQLGALVPAMGYGDEQMKDLGETIARTPADVVLVATPIDLRRIIKIDKPALRVRYELQEIGKPDLEDALARF